MAADAVAQAAVLKAEAQKATVLRAQAEAQVTHAQKELRKIDADLRTLGVNPEQAADELRLLEEQLAATTAEVSAALAVEVAAYREIIQAASHV